MTHCTYSSQLFGELCKEAKTTAVFTDAAYSGHTFVFVLHMCNHLLLMHTTPIVILLLLFTQVRNHLNELSVLGVIHLEFCL